MTPSTLTHPFGLSLSKPFLSLFARERKDSPSTSSGRTVLRVAVALFAKILGGGATEIKITAKRPAGAAAK